MADAAGRSYAAFYANLKAQLGDKSASDLLEELNRKLDGAGEGAELTDEETMAYMDLINELEPEPENPAFEAFTQAYIDRGMRSVSESDPAESNSKSRRSFRHFAGVLVAVCGIFMALMLFAYGEEAWNTTIKTVGDIMHTGPSTSGKLEFDEDESGFKSLEEALTSYGIDAEGIALVWIPENFAIDVIEVKELKLYDEFSAAYASDNDEFLVLRIMAYKTKEPDLDHEIIEGTKTEHKVNGQKYVIVENNNQYAAFWENGRCICSITGNISKSQIKEIINSIAESGN